MWDFLLRGSWGETYWAKTGGSFSSATGILSRTDFLSRGPRGKTLIIGHLFATATGLKTRPAVFR